MTAEVPPRTQLLGADLAQRKEGRNRVFSGARTGIRNQAFALKQHGIQAVVWLGGSSPIMPVWSLTEKGCVVPMHAELKVGTLAGILRQANVPPEEFIEALGK